MAVTESQLRRFRQMHLVRSHVMYGGNGEIAVVEVRRDQGQKVVLKGTFSVETLLTAMHNELT